MKVIGGVFGFLGGVLSLALPVILAYFVIRLAVRHAIESSDVGMIIKQKYEEDRRNKL